MYAYERMFVLLKQLVICKTKLQNLVQISKCWFNLIFFCISWNDFLSISSFFKAQLNTNRDPDTNPNSNVDLLNWNFEIETQILIYVHNKKIVHSNVMFSPPTARRRDCSLRCSSAASKL